MLKVNVKITYRLKVSNSKKKLTFPVIIRWKGKLIKNFTSHPSSK